MFDLLRKRIEAMKQPVLPANQYVFGGLSVGAAEATNRTIDAVLKIIAEVESEFNKEE